MMDDRNQEATVYIGNLDEKVGDGLLWELMLQAGMPNIFCCINTI